MQLPRDPRELAGDPVRAAKTLENAYAAAGFSGLEDLARDCVGANHKEWREYSQPSGTTAKWNLDSLFVKTYLDQLDITDNSPVVSPPSGLGLDVIQDPRNLLDFHDICLSVASKWRQNPFEPSFWHAVRVLERELAAVIAAACPSPHHNPKTTSVVIDICVILSYLWAQEYLLKTVLPPTEIQEAPEFDNEDALAGWVESERKRALVARISLKQPILTASLFPGELERYARHNGGIFASDLATAIEDTRPYIAFKALTEAVETLEPHLGSGIIAMHLVNRYMVATLKFPWAKHNVFVDVAFMDGEIHQQVRCRTTPWIILVGSLWYVVHQGEVWKTQSPIRAILLWWSRFGSGTFYAGWDSWNLGDLRDFPPS
jgi:hypothetical protein